jgi:RND family efflux transporter MFP subunit
MSATPDTNPRTGTPTAPDAPSELDGADHNGHGTASSSTVPTPIAPARAPSGAAPPPEVPPLSRRTGGPKKWVPWVLLGAAVLGTVAYRARQGGQTAGGPGGQRGAGGGGGGAGGPGGGRGKQDTIANVERVKLASLSQSLPLIGSLRANQTIDLNSQIPGRVSRVLVNEGARVRRGQLLITLDDEDLRSQVNGARAGVAQAVSRLQQARVQLPARSQSVQAGIALARAQVLGARARYRQARLSEPVARSTAENQVRNTREAVQTARTRLQQAQQTAEQIDRQTQAAVRSVEAQVRGATSGVRTAQAGVRSAEAGIRSARANRERLAASLAEVRRGSRDQQVATAQAAVALAEAQVRDAQRELDRQRILFQGGATARASFDAAQTRFEVAQAQLESARQNLSLVREGATSEQVRQAEQALAGGDEGVRQAQAALGQAQGGVGSARGQLGQAQANLAQANADRIRALTEQGNIAAAFNALSQAQAAYQTARANLAQIPITRQETRNAFEAVRQAEANLRTARSTLSQVPVARSEVAIAQADVRARRATLQQALVNLRYARIYSPVNGVVNTKLADVGESAGQGQSLLNLVSLDRVYFEAQVPESAVSRLRVGQPVQVNVSSISDRPLRGFISDIIPVAEVRLRQFRVRVTIPNAPRQLTPGAFARGTVMTEQIFNAMTVPLESVARATDGKRFVFVAVKVGDKTQMKRRVVQVGLESNGRIQIRGGLRPGDRVALDPSSFSDGEEVKAVDGAASDVGGGSGSASTSGGAST